jgi:hypothetical protein
MTAPDNFIRQPYVISALSDIECVPSVRLNDLGARRFWTTYCPNVLITKNANSSGDDLYAITAHMQIDNIHDNSKLRKNNDYPASVYFFLSPNFIGTRFSNYYLYLPSQEDIKIVDEQISEDGIEIFGFYISKNKIRLFAGGYLLYDLMFDNENDYANIFKKTKTKPYDFRLQYNGRQLLYIINDTIIKMVNIYRKQFNMHILNVNNISPCRQVWVQQYNRIALNNVIKYDNNYIYSILLSIALFGYMVYNKSNINIHFKNLLLKYNNDSNNDDCNNDTITNNTKT